MSAPRTLYRGRLSPAEAAEGMNLAVQNARRLLTDASVLLDRGSYATAASLAILAIEETGKVSVLRAVLLARSDEELKQEWKSYRSHTDKNVAWVIADLANKGARTLEDLKPMYDKSSDHPQVLDQLKQLGFYTDCVSGPRWTNPSEAIPRDLAEMLVRIAGVLSGGSPQNEEALRLWVKHLGPVWKGEMSSMKQALINWHQEMIEKGLTTIGAEEFDKFVGAPRYDA
jgi:AbiV family abortive infection protein